MRSCFLMGQHDAPDSLQETLTAEIERLVRFEGVTEITVGHRGNFDRMATVAAQCAARRRPELYLYRLVAYHDASDTVALPELFEGYYYPLALYHTPKSYAIIKANQLTLDESDFFVTYANREGGNAGSLLKRAKRLEKKGYLKVINLAEI